MIFDWVKFNLYEKGLLPMKIKKQCLGSDPSSAFKSDLLEGNGCYQKYLYL